MSHVQFSKVPGWPECPGCKAKWDIDLWIKTGSGFPKEHGPLPCGDKRAGVQ